MLFDHDGNDILKDYNHKSTSKPETKLKRLTRFRLTVQASWEVAYRPEMPFVEK
jgi:hypothetical protein